jgi:polyisoprenoid-binding protein YceI
MIGNGREAMKRLAILLVACAALSAPSRAQSPTPAEAIPAGSYTLDKTHASLVFRVNHLGFSFYTARFADFDAALEFDPAKPAETDVTATIDANSLELPSPPEGFTDTLKGPDWLDTANHPQITFKSTSVEPTGPSRARITGNLTLHGETKPVTLDATFNGGWAGHEMDPHARIGFSATGSFRRSDFGVDYGIPEPGSSMGVGDEVEIIIEAEFTGPPLSADAAE